MSTVNDKSNFLINGAYITPGLDIPKIFYANYLYYSTLYLKRGIELWNPNPIKFIISRVDYNKLCYLDETCEKGLGFNELEMQEQNQKILSGIEQYILDNGLNLDIPILMMGISVERALKGLLLNNGFVIHKHNFGLVKISGNPGDYTRLNREVYSLEEFTENIEILEAALIGESEDSVRIFKIFLSYLKNLRDIEVHQACERKPACIHDLILFKMVDNLMHKANRAFTIANKKLDNCIKWTNRANSLNDKNLYYKALKYAEKALNINPLLKEAKINKGNSLTGLKDYEGAIKCYDEVIAIDPSVKEAYNNKGNALLFTKEYDESIRSIEKAIELDQKYPAAFVNMGNVLNRLGRHEEAIKYADKAIELNPLQKEAWGNKGDALFGQGMFKEAIASYDKVIQLDPKNAQAWSGKGNALSMIGQHDEAIEILDNAIKLDPKLISSWLGKGFSMNALGHFDESIKCYNHVNKIDSNIDINPMLKEIWYNKGNDLFKKGRHNDAVNCYDRTIELDPCHANAWDAKGLAFIRLGLWHKSILCLNKAVELDKNAHLWYKKAIAFCGLKDYNNAIRACETALKIDPEYLAARISLAACYRNLDKKEEFIRECEIAGRFINKENEYNRACFNIVSNDFEKGLSLLIVALEKHQVDLDWIRKDPDLEFIRNTTDFRLLMERLSRIAD